MHQTQTLVLRRDDPRPRVAAALLAPLAGLLALSLSWPGRQAAPPVVVRTLPPRAAAPAPAPKDEAAVLLDNRALSIGRDDAASINAARDLDRKRLSPATPFLASAAGGPGAGAQQCLTQAIYYEAASESDRGERAVAQVVLNRVRHPLFPHSVCGVVFQGANLRTGCQFSFTCDGSLARRPSAAGWARAGAIAAAALAGRVEPSVGLSTHYHADYVVPYWAGSLDKVATIGAHIFYLMRGVRGAPAAFAAPYDGQADGPPVLNLDAAGVAALPGGDAVAGATARLRTEVREDALGAPAATVAAAAQPAGALRADEARTDLVADLNKGELAPGR